MTRGMSMIPGMPSQRDPDRPQPRFNDWHACIHRIDTSATPCGVSDNNRGDSAVYGVPASSRYRHTHPTYSTHFLSATSLSNHSHLLYKPGLVHMMSSTHEKITGFCSTGLVADAIFGVVCDRLRSHKNEPLAMGQLSSPENESHSTNTATF